jgi:RNA polymerase sigma-70 factor, ECF subfamily
MHDDNTLIARFVSQQDEKAFTTLLVRYQSAIRQFLRRLTGGHYPLADDLAQETFLLMYCKLHTFNGQSTLSTWLHKIAYHCFLQDRQARKTTESLDSTMLELTANDGPDLNTDIMLEQLMRHLSIDERLVLTLTFSAGMSHSEIVIVTDFPLGTVKSHINRAKNKLAHLLTH